MRDSRCNESGETVIWMERISTFVQDFLPGSIPLLLLGLLVGVVLIYSGNWSKCGRRILLGVLTLYGLMSLPIGSDAFRAGLERGYGSLASRAAAQGATAVVVLSGGTRTYRTESGEINSMSRPTALRTLETVRVYRLLDDPWVIVSGGIGDSRTTLSPESKPMRVALIEAGVPEERILVEPASRNTYEHAFNLESLLADYSIERFVLVTSPVHMWRARATFGARGLRSIPSVSATQPSSGNRFVPSDSALQATRGYLREYFALMYYWSRGWLTQPE